MPSAFEYKLKKFDLSINYDGITFYPKCDLGKEASLYAKKISSGGVAVNIDPGYETEEGRHFKQFCQSLEKLTKYQKISPHDDNHDFYHNDTLSKDNEHIDLRFPAMLSQAKLSQILQLLVRNQLITQIEKNNLLLDYDHRIVSARCDLYLTLIRNQEDDKKTIINYIKQCEDNEILVDLHRYLATDRYDYLRAFSPSQDKPWQGTNKKRQVVATSEAWAQIEKCIALQMAHNIKENVSEFTPHLASERAQQLAQHAFFAIKRKQHDGEKMSKMYIDFSKGDADEFEKRYMKAFK